MADMVENLADPHGRQELIKAGDEPIGLGTEKAEPTQRAAGTEHKPTRHLCPKAEFHYAPTG